MATFSGGAVSVSLLANTAQYTQKLRQARKRGKKEFDGMEKDAKKSGKGVAGGLNSMEGAATSLFKGGALAGVAGGIATIGVAAAAAAVKIYGMGVELNNQRKELKAYAGITGMAVSELQAMQGAVSGVIQADQLTDNIKDFSDYLGDYVQSGAGAFKDIVEGLGDSLGYTADQLAKMDSGEAFIKVGSAIADSNLPMSQQIFLMESIASESSKLLPLLKDNAKEFNRLQYESSMMTRQLDESLESYGHLQKQLTLLNQNFGDLISDALAPAYKWVGDLTLKWNQLFAAMEEGSEAHRLSRMAEITDEMKQLRKDIEDTESAWGRFGNALSMTSTDSKALKKELSDLQKEYDKLLKIGIDALSVNTPDTGTTTPVDPQAWYGSTDFNKVMEEAKKAQAAQEANEKRIADAKKSRQDKALADQKAYNEKMIEADVASFNTMNKLKEEFARNQQAKFESDLMDEDEPLKKLEMQHNRELEMLKQQYEQKKLLESEYQLAMKQSKEQYYADIFAAHQASVSAELALYQNVASGIGNQIAALAGATDEEKRALTKQFVLKQGLAAADASLNYYATISAHEATAASLGVGGSAYLATQTGIATANYQKNLLGIGAVTLGGLAAGQFHSGTDHVPSEGSYLLQAGERVIQPKANKDLTSFLNGKQGGGETKIEANFTVNGNVTDEKWFSEQLVKQRNTIAAAVSKVNRERPKARSRTSR